MQKELLFSIILYFLFVSNCFLCPVLGEPIFPLDLDCVSCSRKDIHEFGLRVKELGIPYVGLCCGNSAHFTRSLAESLGRTPPASRYTPNLNKHWLLGKDEKLANLRQDEKAKYGKTRNIDQ